MSAYHNEEIVVFASAARTASVDSADFENMNGRGVKVVIDATASSGSPSAVFTIQGKDPASGKYYTLLASAAIIGTGTTVLTVYPGITPDENAAADDVLSRHWRVSVANGNSDSITYSVGACTIL